jgi:hypothetical protein
VAPNGLSQLLFACYTTGPHIQYPKLNGGDCPESRNLPSRLDVGGSLPVVV